MCEILVARLPAKPPSSFCGNKAVDSGNVGRINHRDSAGTVGQDRGARPAVLPVARFPVGRVSTVVCFRIGLGSQGKVAVEELPTASGPADYALFVSGKLFGIIEANFPLI
jgi:hypothetical protein